MHQPGSSKHPPHEPGWIWAESGAGPFCCEAQADGVPCFEVGRDCEECEKGREGWMRLQARKHTGQSEDRFP